MSAQTCTRVILACLIAGVLLIGVGLSPSTPALPEITELCDSVSSNTLYETRVEGVASDKSWIRVSSELFDFEALKGTSERVPFCKSNGKLVMGAELVKVNMQVRICIKSIMGKRVISCIAFL